MKSPVENRCHIRFMTAFLTIVAVIGMRTVPAVADDRPNVLFAIADDWSWPHAGAYGDPVVQTPTFDRVADEGVLFTHAFCVTPSCTPSRGSLLTGQEPHRLEQGGNLWSSLPRRFVCYPDLLERAGYVVGHTRKGWGPGRIDVVQRERNPAGPRFKNFEAFLKTVPDDKPFCFWFGSTDPHRAYEPGRGRSVGMRIEDVKVPPFLPDTPEVRDDILDYYYEVQRFDHEVGDILDMIERTGRLANTLVIMTSDNGMPFPRAKTNVYDSGTRMPLAVRWAAKVKGGRREEVFVDFTDLAPTILEAAGLEPLPEMTGESFLNLLATGESAVKRERVFLERERHGLSRKGNVSYPVRALRTREFLYVRNLMPDRWPAGDPDPVGKGRVFGDIDASPTKHVLLSRRDDPAIRPYFELACAKRPAEELYDLSKDPHQLTNVADRPEYTEAKTRLRKELEAWRRETGDPRLSGRGEDYDRWPYYGRQRKPRQSKPAGK